MDRPCSPGSGQSSLSSIQYLIYHHGAGAVLCAIIVCQLERRRDRMSRRWSGCCMYSRWVRSVTVLRRYLQGNWCGATTVQSSKSCSNTCWTVAEPSSTNELNLIPQTQFIEKKLYGVWQTDGNTLKEIKSLEKCCALHPAPDSRLRPRRRHPPGARQCPNSRQAPTGAALRAIARTPRIRVTDGWQGWSAVKNEDECPGQQSTYCHVSMCATIPQLHLCQMLMTTCYTYMYVHVVHPPSSCKVLANKIVKRGKLKIELLLCCKLAKQP